MATTLYQPNSGILDHKGLASLYSKTFDKIVERKCSIPVEGAQFFAERMTDLETYKEGQVLANLDVPQRNEDTDRIPLATPLDGYNQTWTNIQRRLGIMVTRRAVKSQKTRMIAKLMTGLPDSARALEELAYATVFNGGFDTVSGGDGSYVFATDHNQEDQQFADWANKPGSGSGFTTDSYFAAWLNFQGRKNAKGLPDPQLPTQVVYPPAIHEDVMKVRGSDKYPQNSLNAKLPELFGAFEPVPYHWLTSTTAWFVRGKKDVADQGFIIVWQDKPTYAPISDSMNPELIMGRRLLMSFSVGVLDSHVWYGNAGV